MANERLTLETLAVETLYSGQFALKINLVDQTELSCHTPPPPTDAVLQFLYKLSLETPPLLVMISFC